MSFIFKNVTYQFYDSLECLNLAYGTYLFISIL